MRSLLVVLAGGLVFGFGLAYSGLAKQEVVLSFLHLEDLGLAVTMIAALAISLPVYQLAPRLLGRPPLGGQFERFPRGINSRHITGGVLFGMGWGISGVCPGAAVASIGLGNWPIVAALTGMALGAYLQGSFLARPKTPAASAGVS